MSVTRQLRKLVASNNAYVAPGVFDGLSAKLVEQAGFELIYASGGAIARSSGFPDLGLISQDEVLSRLTQMVEVTHVPIIADADTGFGNTLNVRRTVAAFERAGLAGLHIEDQQFPKRCGHLSGKRLISLDEMVDKVKAARDVLVDDQFLIIARTDAIAVEGFEQAIERANAYFAAGADMIFVEAPETVEQIEQISSQVQAPKLINMFYGGKTPMVPKARLAELGFQIIIIPSDLQRAAIHAMQATLAEIDKNGNSEKINAQLTSFSDREKIIATQEYLDKA